jgi:DNA (cytosine-5)-methyltransferase 1
LDKRQNGRRFKENNEEMFTITGQDRHGVLQIDKLGNIYPSNHESGDIYNINGICGYLGSQGNHEQDIFLKEKIRKLTPLECWRLMGFDDKDYWKTRNRLEKVYYNGRDRSDSQMYKMAGNSIVVNVLEFIFKSLFGE